jgi:hypothetical protein
MALGLLGILAGIIVGVYVGVWLCFIGGIMGLFHVLVALIAGKVLAGTLAFSILKIVLSGFLGWLSASVLILPSYALMVSGS